MKLSLSQTAETYRVVKKVRKVLGTHFCYRLSRTQGNIAIGRIRSIEKSNDLIGNRTRDLQTCSTAPQPTMLQRAPSLYIYIYIYIHV
jgi:hypothetical protein